MNYVLCIKSYHSEIIPNQYTIELNQCKYGQMFLMVIKNWCPNDHLRLFCIQQLADDSIKSL